MTKIINLFCGPGGGKSSIASGLLYELKKKHITCDAPYEFPKLLAWDENYSAIKDQLYVIANQHRGIVKSWGKVDYIIMDSPILLSLTYRLFYDNLEYPSYLYGESFDKMILNIHSNYDNINIFLERNIGIHNEKERFHNLEKSIELDHVIKKTLNLNNITYNSIKVNEHSVDNILKLIL